VHVKLFSEDVMFNVGNFCKALIMSKIIILNVSKFAWKSYRKELD